MDWLELIVRVAFAATSAYLFMEFLRVLLPMRPTFPLKLFGACLVLTVLHLFRELQISSYTAGMAFAITVDILFCLLCFGAKWHRIVCSVAGYYAITFFCSRSVTYLILALFSPDLPVTPPVRISNTFQLAANLAVHLLRYVIVASLWTALSRKQRSIHSRYRIRLLIPPVCSILTIFFTYPALIRLTDNIQVYRVMVLLTVNLFLLLCFLFSFFISVTINTSRYLDMQSAYEEQREYSRAWAERQLTIRRMMHDLRHHYIYLYGALQDQDVDRARQYLEALDESLHHLEPLQITGNQDADVLLRAKIMQARQHGVTIAVNGELPANMGFDPVDIVIVLGNALDNAIESCLKLEPPTEIAVAFGYHQNRLSIRLSNPYGGRLRKKGPHRFWSAKGVQHGLGLEIMRSIAEKYNGCVLIDTREHVFILTILFQEPVRENILVDSGGDLD